MKKETLEEAAEKYAKSKSSSSVFQEAHKRDFITGANYQAERMYSEEDLRQAFRDGQSNMHYSDNFGLDSSLTEQQWFEQNKKK